jgi:hypothetical protein
MTHETHGVFGSDVDYVKNKLLHIDYKNEQWSPKVD